MMKRIYRGAVVVSTSLCIAAAWLAPRWTTAGSLAMSGLAVFVGALLLVAPE